jgi:hypothetical protein
MQSGNRSGGRTPRVSSNGLVRGVYSAIFFEANAKSAWGGPLITSAMWFRVRSYRHALAAAYPGCAWFQFEVSTFGILCVASSMDLEVVN